MDVPRYMYPTGNTPCNHNHVADTTPRPVRNFAYLQYYLTYNISPTESDDEPVEFPDEPKALLPAFTVKPSNDAAGRTAGKSYVQKTRIVGLTFVLFLRNAR